MKQGRSERLMLEKLTNDWQEIQISFYENWSFNKRYDLIHKYFFPGIP